MQQVAGAALLYAVHAVSCSQLGLVATQMQDVLASDTRFEVVLPKCSVRSLCGPIHIIIIIIILIIIIVSVVRLPCGCCIRQQLAMPWVRLESLLCAHAHDPSS